MHNHKFLFAIILCLLGTSFFSCQPEEMITGSLEVQFSRSMKLSDSHLPRVYSTENEDHPLFENLLINDSGLLTLETINYGNYILEYSLEVDFGDEIVRRKGFQINPGERTSLLIHL